MLSLPTLQSLGLGNIRPLRGVPPAAAPRASYGRMAESSPGKDSVTGHWEIAGVVLDRPFPTFPAGFPPEVIDAFEREIGRGTLGNEVASGTEIIARLGDAHVASGKPIVYTSADSVFQIAAHEAVVPVPELYRMCEAAYRSGRRGHGRRAGDRAALRRHARRLHAHRQPARLRDAVAAADACSIGCVEAGVTVTAIGKIADLFAGRGITTTMPTTVG